MPLYTCITSNRGHSYVSQHVDDNAKKALRQHISQLPFIDEINPIGDELYWLQSITLGKRSLTLEQVAKCDSTWKWIEGENYSPPYCTFIIKN